MLHSLVQLSRTSFLSLCGILVLCASCIVHSDSNVLPDLFIDNLLSTTAQNTWDLPAANTFDDQNSNNARLYEGSQATQKLAKLAVKFIWHAMAYEQPTLDHYAGIVDGQFTTRSNGVDYGIQLTTDIVRLHVDYAF